MPQRLGPRGCRPLVLGCIAPCPGSSHVSCSLEVETRRQSLDLIAARLEPPLELRFLWSPLLIAKLAEDHGALRHDPGIGGKDHIRQARHPLDALAPRAAVLLHARPQGCPLPTRRPV